MQQEVIFTFWKDVKSEEIFVFERPDTACEHPDIECEYPDIDCEQPDTVYESKRPIF